MNKWLSNNILSCFVFIASAAFSIANAAPAVFWQDNFEGLAPSVGGGIRVVEGPAVGSYGADGAHCDAGDYFERISHPGEGDGLGAQGYLAVFSNIQDNNYWRAEDLDGLPSPCVASPHTISWPAINITGKTDLRFSGFFAAFDSSVDGFDPWEETDGLEVAVKLDAGPFIKILEFKGAPGDKNVLHQVTPLGGPVLTHALTQVPADFLSTGGIPIPVSGTDTLLELKITVYSDGGVEEIGFDHFQLTEAISTAPEMDVTGAGNSIVNGDNTPEAADGTDFGDVALVGDSNVNTFTIENSGTAGLTLTGAPIVAISGAHPGDFNVTVQATSPVPSPGGTTTFDITFDPTVEGLREAVVSIDNDDSDENPYTFSIQGRSGAEIAVQGNGNLIDDGDSAPSAVDNTDFGATDTSVGSISKTFTIENSGADPLVLSGAPSRVAIVGTHAAEFSLSSDATSPVASGGSTAFTIVFDPAANGVREALVSIHNNDLDEASYTFAIQGTGSGVTFWTDDFENTAPTAGTRTPADGTQCASGSYFVRADNAGEGTPTGTLGYEAVFSNLQGGRYWRAEDLDGTASPCNSSPQILSWTGIDISGRGELHFSGMFGSQTTSAGVWDGVDGLILDAKIDAGGFATLLEFRPNAAGTNLEQVGTGTPIDEALKSFNAPLPGTGATLELRMTVHSDGGGEEIAFDQFTLESDPPLAAEIEVSGAGVEIVDGDTSPDSLDDTDFGNVASGSNSTNTFTISNLGSTVLNLTAGMPLITVSGANPADFVITPGPASSIPAFDSTSFGIRFTPGGTGLRTASISIANSDIDESLYTFSVQGSSTSEIGVTGNGVAIVNGASSASSADDSYFGEVLAGTGSTSKVFTIENNGVNDLNLTHTPAPVILISGPDAADFTVSLDATMPIVGAGGSSNFEITFSPVTAGNKTATITIDNDDFDDDPFTFTIEGIARGDVFWTDDFEGSSSSTVPRFAPNHWETDLANGTHCGAGDYFMRADNPGPDAGLGYQYEFTNIEGSHYWRAEDLDACVANPDLVEWQNIVISGKANIHFNGHFAAGTGIAGVWDVPDGMTVEYSIDGGGLQPLLAFSRKGGVNATHLALDGTGREISEAFSAFHAPILGTGNVLTLRIGVRADGGAEEMGFDFFTLEADPPVMEVSGNGILITNGDMTPELPDFTDFTVVPVGSSQSREFEISNAGFGVSDLELTGVPLVTISGPNPGDFVVTQQPVLSALPGGNMTPFSVEFIPASPGEKIAIITIDNNDPDDNPYEFSIKGTAVPPVVDLSVTKTDGVTSAIPGAGLTYTIVASNAGPATDPAATLTDTFPAELSCSYTSLAAGGATGNTAAGIDDLNETLSLPAGGSVTYTVSCTIDSSATGTLTNTATITASVTDTVPANNSATDGDTLLTPEADLSITKTDGVASAVPGQTVTYTIVANNAGPSDDPSVALSDTFPAALSCTYTSVVSGGATENTASGSGNLAETLSMPSGSTVTYTATCAIDSGATGTLSNTATISASVTDSVPGNNSATDGDTVLVPEADLSVTKTDGVTSAIPGQDSLIYTIMAANTGPSDDPSVALADVFPAGLICSYTSIASDGASGNSASGVGNLAETLSMPAGSSATYTATCAIDAGATGTLSNTVTLTPSVTDAVSGNNSATDNNTVLTPQGDLSITKTDGVTSAVPGQSVSYTIVASNAGPSHDPAVIVSDTFPAVLSCTYTSVAGGGATGNTAAGSGNLSETLSMPSGSSVTYTALCAIDAFATGTLSNTATISASVTDTLPGNNSATDGDTVLAPEADLSITKTDGVTSAVPGQNLNYSIVASNAGPSDDPAATVSDAFPAALTCTYTSVASGGATGNTAAGSGDLAETLSMPAGSSVTYSATCAIDADATGTLSNTATISASVTDTVPGNNSATDGDTVLAPEVDLSITKTDGVISAVPGQSLVYTIVASNAGSSDDPSVGVSDTFPATLTCTYTSVASGGATGNTASGSGNLAETLSMPASSSVTYTATCAIDSGATGTLSNTATISASVTDTVPGNNSATDGDTVLVPEADLSVTKTDGVTSAIPGQDSLIYTIIAANAGPSDDPSVTLSDTFPVDLSCSYTSIASNGATGNTANGSGDLAETLSMPSGSSVSYTATCAIDASATGTLSNTATISASVTDTVPGNNSATDGDTVLAPEADLSITKTDGVTLAISGQTVTYTIVANNAGPSDDPVVTVQDTFPADLSCTYTSVASGGANGNTASGSGDISETLSMPSGSSVTYTATCIIDAAATGTLSNTATITASVTDPDAGNNSATDDDTVLDPQADLAISIVDDVDPVVTGNALNYTISVTNAGPSSAVDVAVNTTLPAGVSLISSSGCNEDPAAIPTCTLGTIAAGGSALFTIEVMIDPTTVGLISISADVSASTTDPQGTNDSATEETLVEAIPPLFDISFTPDAIEFTTLSVLSYAIDNSVSSVDADALAFSNTLPANVVVAAIPGITNTCVGGSVVALAGSGSISYAGGTVSALDSCTISVNVTSAINGEYINLTGTLISDNGDSGTATATLTVTGDIDGDLVHDDIDNCEFMANADQLDFEADGIGDLCDEDDDNDEMPDYWEILHGLDPRNSWDRDEDPDLDGFTNIEEFEFKTDPNVFDADTDNNGIPDTVETRGHRMVPIINYILL